MKRTLLLLCLTIVGLSGLGMLHASPAAAAGSFTIDSPGDGEQVAPKNGAIEFEGSVSLDVGDRIHAYVDGLLVTCQDYFGNELAASTGCWNVASVEGSRWTFGISPQMLERRDQTFFGVHEVRFVLAEVRIDEATIFDDQTIRVEFVETLPESEPEPVETALAPEPEAGPGEEPGLTAPGPIERVLGDPAAPTVLSSLRTVADAAATPPVGLLVTAAVTIVLLLLVGLPSTLLGQTLSENYDRLFGRVGAAAARATRMLSFPALPRWLPLSFGIVLASVLSSFVDPAFGWNLASVRMLLSMGVAFALESVAGWWVIRAVLRRTDPALDPKPEFKYGSLVIILIAVVLSRLVGFEPGMVFGLVVGLAFGASLALAVDARVKLLGLAWALVIGMLGWLGYSLLSSIPGWLPVFAAETLSAIAVSSLAALPVALLPLAGLDGAVLFRWSRPVWAALYAVGLFLFFVVLMPMPFSWGEVGAPLASWVGLYLGYAVLAVAVWAAFRYLRPKTPSAASAQGESAATAASEETPLAAGEPVETQG